MNEGTISMARKKASKPRNTEAAMVGPEPEFSGPISRTQLISNFNWYNYTSDQKRIIPWITTWMKSQKYSSKDISTVSKSSSKQLTQTIASIARMLNRGLVDDEMQSKLESCIESVLNETPRKIVQVKIKKIESHNELIAELDTLLDDFYSNGYKECDDISSIVKNKSNKFYSDAIVYYSELLNELVSDDEEIKEGYKHLKKIEMKRYISLIESILVELGQQKQNQKRQRKPRARKIKPVDQIVSKMKYAQSSDEYNIVSISPIKILESSTLWLFNTKTRKLTCLIAIEGQKFSVKGTTIQNIDLDQSYTKMIRKPNEILPMVLMEPKKRLDKQIKELSTKETVANGRVNEETILVRAFK